MNPYEAPKITEEPSDDKSELVPDDYWRKLLALIFAGACTAAIMVASVTGLYGLGLLRMAFIGRGRFEGRALVVTPIALIVIVLSLLVVLLGILGIRYAWRTYKPDEPGDA